MTRLLINTVGRSWVTLNVAVLNLNTGEELKVCPLVTHMAIPMQYELACSEIEL